MLKDILLLQKREIENKLKEQYIERLNHKLELKNNLIKVIIGPRRAGKSFFALHFLSKQEKFGYVNFDDEKLIEIGDYDEIVAAINSIYNNPKLIFFDEIQNVANWELFANRLQRQGYNLVITGSNSKLLNKELATHLTGRHIPINIFPFSFKEFLGKKELTTHEIKENLDSYLLHGGYPEPLTKNLDYKDYLSTLFNSIVYKDIVKRYKVRSVQGIEDIAFYLLSNITKEYSYNALCKIAKINSSHTAEKYINYLEDTFLFFSLKRFSYKVKEQLSSNKKIYSVDNGFVYAKGFKTSPDIGKLYENIVAQELKRDELNNKIRLYYWKNQQQEEVDFVIQENTKIRQLLQVCFDIKDLETKNREVRALLKAGKELKCKSLIIITENYESKQNVKWFDMGGVINFIPLWKWLLER